MDGTDRYIFLITVLPYLTLSRSYMGGRGVGGGGGG